MHSTPAWQRTPSGSWEVSVDPHLMSVLDADERDDIEALIEALSPDTHTHTLTPLSQCVIEHHRIVTYTVGKHTFSRSERVITTRRHQS